jgi:prephenate dehydratase/chorismate mutase/prephenate dehydratase
LSIIGEIRLPISHCLLTLPATDYREIKTVYSHPQALAQCRGFLQRNKLETIPFYDTAGAAKMISETQLKGAAAIATKFCANQYHLEVVKENIADDLSNSTRFLIVSKDRTDTNGNKCSIVFSTSHQAGALFSVLEIFSKAKINLTRIESRPQRNGSEGYYFLLDFRGSEHDQIIKNTLDTVKANVPMYKFLGCYKEVVS